MPCGATLEWPRKGSLVNSPCQAGPLATPAQIPGIGLESPLGEVSSASVLHPQRWCHRQPPNQPTPGLDPVTQHFLCARSELLTHRIHTHHKVVAEYVTKFGELVS